MTQIWVRFFRQLLPSSLLYVVLQQLMLELIVVSSEDYRDTCLAVGRKQLLTVFPAVVGFKRGESFSGHNAPKLKRVYFRR